MCAQYFFVFAMNNKRLREMCGLTNTRFFAPPQLERQGDQYIASAVGASEENFGVFREVFISRTMVLYRKFITDSATTSTMNVFSFDRVANSSRPQPL